MLRFWNEFDREQRGVTYIELIIVISIFSILAGTLLLNFTRFGRNITLQNLAQDIALQINQAQKDAISGRTNDVLATCDRLTRDCAPRYGVYLTTYADGSNNVIAGYGGTPGKTLLTFFDYMLEPTVPDNMLHNGYPACGTGLGTECLDNISLGQGNYISEICVGIENECTEDITGDYGLNIVFKRPFPDAIITTDVSSGAVYNYAKITVSSPNSDTASKDIIVTGLGQISVQSHQ